MSHQFCSQRFLNSSPISYSFVFPISPWGLMAGTKCFDQSEMCGVKECINEYSSTWKEGYRRTTEIVWSQINLEFKSNFGVAAKLLIAIFRISIPSTDMEMRFIWSGVWQPPQARLAPVLAFFGAGRLSCTHKNILYLHVSSRYSGGQTLYEPHIKMHRSHTFQFQI